MYEVKIHSYLNTSRVRELIDEFISPDEYIVLRENEEARDPGNTFLEFNKSGSSDLNEIKREIFRTLSRITGYSPAWGILTGVRPVKLAGELMASGKSAEETQKYLIDSFYLSDSKAKLLTDIYEYQKRMIGDTPERSVGLYVGIPFCPTRCLYCSFASNKAEEHAIRTYMAALQREMAVVGARTRAMRIRPESVYVGGGTPTTLDQRTLGALLAKLEMCFDLSEMKEYTVEAGRPDTLDPDKLKLMKDNGVTRISINPQTMKARTLELIGRNHTPEDVEKAFEMAMKVGFDSVNADIIAGLPEEDIGDFRNTLSRVLEMGADNVTVHSLAVKRASRLHEMDPGFHYKQARVTKEMIDHAASELGENGFRPYYLYRQKHMAGFGENTGYCRDDKAGVYNIRIMDEHQSILALGAGAVSKIYFPEENRHERVANVTNYTEYISRIDEMIDRKNIGFFDQMEE